MKRLVGIALATLCAACVNTQPTLSPSAVPISSVGVSPSPITTAATATPLARTYIAECSFPYPTPSPQSGDAFVSEPDPANGGVRYTGTITYTHGMVGSLSSSALYISNSTTIPLRIPPTDFILVFPDGHTAPLAPYAFKIGKER